MLTAGPSVRSDDSTLAVDGELDGARRPAGSLVWWGRVARQNWLLLALLVVGAAVRALAFYAYRPGLFFFGDSWGYLDSAGAYRAHAQHPFGYPAFLRVMSWTGQLSAVTFVQHLAGLGLGIAVYAVLVRRGSPRTLAAVFAAPLLLDAYLVDLEQQIMSETLFAVLVLAAVFVVMRTRVGAWSAAGAGLLLCAATLTRNVALPLCAVFVVYLLIRRVGWRPIAAFVAAVVVPILLYGLWIPASAGSFATSADSGEFIYGRVATFADCGVLPHLTPAEKALCPSGPPATRPDGNFYAWNQASSPFYNTKGPNTVKAKVGTAFSIQVIEHQPVAYARQVAHDFVHYLAPGHTIGRHDSSIMPWTFPTSQSSEHLGLGLSIGPVDLAGDAIARVPHLRADRLLRSYQRVLYTPGPVLLLLMLLGAAGAWFGRGRRERLDALFAVTLGVGLLVVPAATSIFDYRYALATIPVLCLGGGLGTVALLRRRRGAEPEVDVSAGRPVATTSTATAPASVPMLRRAPVRVAGGIVFVGLLVVMAPMHRNPIFETYSGVRAEFGSLGPAIGVPFALPGEPRTKVQRYQHGFITRSAAGTYKVGLTVTRAIRGNGGITAFGAATSVQHRWSTDRPERVQLFEHGAVFFGRDHRSRQVIVGPVFATWWSTQGALGAPLGSATRSGADLVQLFANGSITVHDVDGPGGGVGVAHFTPVGRPGVDLGRARTA